MFLLRNLGFFWRGDWSLGWITPFYVEVMRFSREISTKLKTISFNEALWKILGGRVLKKRVSWIITRY